MRVPLKFLHWALVIVHWSFAAGAFAQSPSPDAPKPPRLRFLFIDETPGYYSLKPAAAYRQISANPYEISAPFIPADFKPLDVYKTLPDPKTGVTRPVKIATVTPSADTPSVLVIITPRPPADADTPAVYKVELIDSNPSLFPAGSIRIINRSPVAMAAQFSSSRVTTAPGEISLVQPVTDARRRLLFKIAIQVQNASGWQLIQDSITVIRPAERMVGILVYSPGGMRHMMSADEIAEMGPPKPGCFWLTFSDTP
ncbi:MAG: hypothetical protein WC661_00925 [Opitutaceae bacterium]|jgi:hypothetical protein